jgi:putative heme degradation protein
MRRPDLAPLEAGFAISRLGAEAVSKASNAKAVLAVLLAAKTSGQHVLVFGGNQGCQARFVYIN